MDIGEAVKLRIQELLDERKITLNHLSYLCGITQSTLNNIISGRNKETTIATIKKICDGLDITIIQFFESKLFEKLDQEVK